MTSFSIFVMNMSERITERGPPMLQISHPTFRGVYLNDTNAMSLTEIQADQIESCRKLGKKQELLMKSLWTQNTHWHS